MSDFFADKTILLPYDFSAASDAAVAEALSMVDASSRVHFLHVVVPINVIAVEPGVLVDLGSDEQRIAHAVQGMKKRIAMREQPVEFVARIGDPGTEVAAYAEQIKADLIVMPSHGRTGLTRLLLGSVAERVLRLAECPVLVLRNATPPSGPVDGASPG